MSPCWAQMVRLEKHTCHCKDLLSAGWEGQSHRKGAKDDEAGLYEVPLPVEGCILSGNQHIQCVSAGHLQATGAMISADKDAQRSGLSHNQCILNSTALLCAPS